LREADWAGRREILYGTNPDKLTTWCEYTAAVWAQQRAAIWRNQEPLRSVFDPRRLQLIEQEVVARDRQRAAHETTRLASFVPVHSAAPSKVEDTSIAAVDSVYPAEADGAAPVAKYSGGERTDPYGEDPTDVLSALKAAKGGERVDAVCRARNLLERHEASSPEIAALERATRKAEHALLQEMGRNAPRYQELMCNDGEPSPSCSCDGNRVGNFRGCCSHHGGIRGCESFVDEPQIECH
jgi:hypothetical protein